MEPGFYPPYNYALFTAGVNRPQFHQGTSTLGINELLTRLIGRVLSEGEYEIVSIREHTWYKRSFRVVPTQPVRPPLRIEWDS